MFTPASSSFTSTSKRQSTTVLLAKLLRDQFSHLQVPVSIVDNDVCEVFFCKVGGSIQNERTYDGFHLVESVVDRLELLNLRLILKNQVSMQNKLTFGLTLSLMEMPSYGLGDYMSISTNEQFVAALHEGFVDAHATCAQLG